MIGRVTGLSYSSRMGNSTDQLSSSLPNLREVGGWRMPDGRSFTSGILFRSAALTNPAVRTDPIVANLGLKVVVDLRTGSETANHPDVLPANAELRHIDILGSAPASAAAIPDQINKQMDAVFRSLTLDVAHEKMLATYRDLVSNSGALAGYAELVRIVLEAGGEPVLYHCTAGKDRTGWATALFMTAAGLPYGSILEEYLGVNPAVEALFAPLARRFVSSGIAPEIAREFIGVQKAYLDTAYAEVESVFNTFEGYLRDGLQLDEGELTALRRLLVV